MTQHPRIDSFTRLAALLILGSPLLAKPQSEPPPSFEEYQSACGSTIVVNPGAADDPGFSDQEFEPLIPDESPIATGSINVPELICICFFIDIGDGFPITYAIYDCGAVPTVGNGGAADCSAGGNTECIGKCRSFPKVDSDQDGVAWPEDDDEPCPLPDTDGDGMPDVWDITPKGVDVDRVPIELNPSGLLPAGMTHADLVILLAAAGVEEYVDLDDFPELDQPIEDSDGDGYITLLDGLVELTKQFDPIGARIVAEVNALSEGSQPGGKKLAAEKLSAFAGLVNFVAKGFGLVAPELLEGLIGEYLDGLGDNIETLEFKVDSEFGEMSLTIKSGASEYTYKFIDNPDGSGSMIIEIRDSLGNEVTLDSMPPGKARDFGDWLKSGTGDPVNTGNGEFYYSAVDFAAPGRGPELQLSRHYGSRSVHKGILGHGWTMPYAETRMVIWPGADTIQVSWGDGRASLFRYSQADDIWEGVGSEYGKVSIRYDADDPDLQPGQASFVVRLPSGMEYHFCQPGWHVGLENGAVSYLRKVSDAHGNALVLRRDQLGNLREVIDTLGRSVTLDYDKDLLNSITGPDGKSVHYEYNDRDQLIRVVRSPVKYYAEDGSLQVGTPGEEYTYAEHPQGYENAPRDVILNHNLESITKLGSSEPSVIVNYHTDPGYSMDKVSWHDVGGEVTEYRYRSIDPESTSEADAYQPQDVDHVTEVLYPDGQRQDFFHGEGLLRRHTIWNGIADSSWGIQSDVYSNPDEGVTHTMWMKLLTYDDEQRLLKTLETTDVLFPSGRELENVYDTLNPDRFQQGNILRMIERPYPAIEGLAELVTEYVYDPITTLPTRTTDPLGRVSTRQFAHHELDYDVARDVPRFKGWGLLPASPTQELAALFGQGDLNRNGLHPGRTGAVRHALPSVTPQGASGPGSASASVAPEQLAIYNDHGQLTSSCDERGTWTQYRYQGGLRSAIIEDPGGIEKETFFSYDVMGRMVESGASGEPRTEYAHDSDGRLELVVEHSSKARSAPPASVGDPGGLVIELLGRELGYDLQGRIVRRTRAFINGERGQAAELRRYDVQGRLIATTKQVDSASSPSLEGTWQRGYDGMGNLIREVSPAGMSADYLYDTRGLLLSITKVGAGGEDLGVRGFEYDAFGSITKLVDEEGRVTTYESDGFGRTVARVGPGGERTEFTLDTMGRVQRTEVRANGSLVAASESDFDALDRVVESRVENFISQPDGTVILGSPAQFVEQFGFGLAQSELLWTVVDPGTKSRLTRHDYDALGRRVATHNGAEGEFSTQLEFDASGRVLKAHYSFDSAGATGQVSPSTVSWSYEYDGMGRPSAAISPSGARSEFWFGLAGELRAYLDSTGLATRYDFNSDGRMVRSKRLGPGGGVGIEESYTYDIEGLLTTSTDGNGVTTNFIYDALNRLVQRVYADATSESYSYDLSGRLSRQVMPGGRSTDLGFDAAGRVISIVASGADADVTTLITRDALGQWLCLDEATQGRLPVRTLRSVDSQGRSVRESTQIGTGPTRQFSAAFDGAGNLASLTYPSGQTIERTFDELGRTLTLSSSLAGQLASFGEHYGFGHARRTSLPGGALVEKEFSPDGRLLTLQTISAGGIPLLGAHYSYDSEGNLEQRVRSRDGRIEEFEYDRFHRLITWDLNVPSTGGPADRSVQWSWDAVENLLALTDSSAPQSLSATTNLLNQLTSLTPSLSGVTYSAAGEELSRSGAGEGLAWEWDALGRPLSVTRNDNGVTFRCEWTHDAVGRVVQRWDAQRGFVRYGHAYGLLREIDSDEHGLREYVGGYDPMRVFWRLENQTTGLYLSTDPMGNVEGLHNGNTIFAAFDYEPFGTVRDALTGELLTSSSTDSELLFLGQPMDLELGFVRLGARLYDPGLGRFVSRDPLREAGGLNLYGYAAGNPLRLKDPSGLSPEEVNDNPATKQSSPLLHGDDGGVKNFKSAIAVMDQLIHYGSDELPDKVSFDGFLSTLAKDPEAAAEVLEFFIDLDGDDLDSSVQESVAWAKTGVEHFAQTEFRSKLEFVLDLPENLLSEGLQWVGIDEATADWFAMGGVAVASFGTSVVKTVAKKGVMKMGKRQAARQVRRNAAEALCFLAGTAIASADGASLPIESVELGQLVACAEVEAGSTLELGAIGSPSKAGAAPPIPMLTCASRLRVGDALTLS